MTSKLSRRAFFGGGIATVTAGAVAAPGDVQAIEPDVQMRIYAAPKVDRRGTVWQNYEHVGQMGDTWYTDEEGRNFLISGPGNSAVFFADTVKEHGYSKPRLGKPYMDDYRKFRGEPDRDMKRDWDIDSPAPARTYPVAEPDEVVVGNVMPDPDEELSIDPADYAKRWKDTYFTDNHYLQLGDPKPNSTKVCFTSDFGEAHVVPTVKDLENWNCGKSDTKAFCLEIGKPFDWHGDTDEWVEVIVHG